MTVFLFMPPPGRASALAVDRDRRPGHAARRVRGKEHHDVGEGSLIASFARALNDSGDAVSSELVRLGVDREAAAFYAEELDDEGVIVVVDADDAHDDEVMRIMREGEGTLQE